ncbi:hypothetical protein OKW21_002560 [Catalinimonas alkaloidigena]|uniref:hypothetical protein n=1 Tax=Catalinimonas alkaloidigena TaxID=1075417 RepID=UPI00240577ED|nr:hypothetical protein [Catalinimonas alkaloidigena]MDF9797297.1 hypothetical protein [Catalinimonas alkaloidigena]
MNNIADNQHTKYQFEDYATSRFAQVSFLKDKKIVLCTLKSDYVPIKHFKDTFSKISELVDQGFNQKFIFDKRSLKAFHQPSMEWYFVVWKKVMFEKGLKIHRKILPPEPWFKKSVEIAKLQINREHEDLIVDLLDIKYCNTIEEAVEN